MNKVEAWLILLVLIGFIIYMFKHDNKVKASKEYKSNIAKGGKPRKYLYTHKWWAWLLLALCFLTVGSQVISQGSSNSTAPKTHKVSTHKASKPKAKKSKKAQAKLSVKDINFSGEYLNDDDVTYKVDRLATYKAHSTDSWSTAPGVVNQVQIAYLKKARRLKPKYLGDNLPTDDKKVDRFLLIHLRIPKAYSEDVHTAIDGGIVALPAKGNVKYGNEIGLEGLVIDGEGKGSLINHSFGAKELDVPCARDYRKETKKGELNITNNMLVVPLSTNMHGLHPLTIKFGANVNNGEHHTYNVKVDW